MATETDAFPSHLASLRKHPSTTCTSHNMYWQCILPQPPLPPSASAISSFLTMQQAGPAAPTPFEVHMGCTSQLPAAQIPHGPVMRRLRLMSREGALPSKADDGGATGSCSGPPGMGRLLLGSRSSPDSRNFSMLPWLTPMLSRHSETSGSHLEDQTAAHHQSWQGLRGKYLQ